MQKSEPRAIWIWLHRYIGLVTLLFLGFAAATGCALCFLRPLDAAINADLFKRPAVAAPVLVPLAVDRFQALHPELQVRSFPLSVAADRTIPVKVEAASKARPLAFNQVFLDRADGHLLGSRSNEADWTRRGAIELLHDIHYTLLAGNTGKWLMGGIALTWLLSNFIGVYLTFPLRAPFWKNWRRTWRFSFKSMLPRLMLDLHRSFGLWLLLPLTALAFTSVALNVFTPLYVPAVTALVPPTPTPFDNPAPYPGGIPSKTSFVRLVELARTTARQNGELWVPASAIYQPKRKLIGVALTNDGTLNYRGLGPLSYYFDSDTGRFVFADSPYGGNTGMALIRMLYPIHSGRVAGPVGVAVVFVSGLATVLFCITGVYVWWKKRRSRIAAKQTALRRGSARTRSPA